MSDVALGHVHLANALRRYIATIRESQQRVIVSELARIAGTTTDDEALHDFRVALRRCRTLLRVAQILWSSKQIHRIERELRYFGRTTGTLRDDDVFRATLTALPASDVPMDEVLAWLANRTRPGRSKRRAIVRILQEGPARREAKDARKETGKMIRPLQVVLAKLERLLDKEPARTCSVAELASVGIAKAVSDVQRAARAELHDALAMHSLRIREKRLRYTAELFPQELGEEGRRLITQATRMQRRLGELHDVDEAIATVGRARGLAKMSQRLLLDVLRVARARCAAKVEPHLLEARTLDVPVALSCNESPSKTTA